MTPTQSTIARIIERQLGCGPVTADNLADPGFLGATSFDSLDIVGLVMTIEEEMFVSISDAEADPFVPNDLGTTKPITKLCTMIDAKLAAKREGVGV
jgi:acyl carrier protein